MSCLNKCISVWIKEYILHWDFWIMLGKKNNYILLLPFMKRLTKRDSINIHMPRLEEENQFYLVTCINRFTILRVLLGDKNCYVTRLPWVRGETMLGYRVVNKFFLSMWQRLWSRWGRKKTQGKGATCECRRWKILKSGPVRMHFQQKKKKN